jgi:hypothetical protein
MWTHGDDLDGFGADAEGVSPPERRTVEDSSDRRGTDNWRYRRLTTPTSPASATPCIPSRILERFLCSASGPDTWRTPSGRSHEAALADIVGFMLKVNPSSYRFEATNARHEHEYQGSETVKWPDGKVLIPGGHHAWAAATSRRPNRVRAGGARTPRRGQSPIAAMAWRRPGASRLSDE